MITSCKDANVAAGRRSAAASAGTARPGFSISKLGRFAANAAAALAALAKIQHMRFAGLRNAPGAAALCAGLARKHAARRGFVAGGAAQRAHAQHIRVLHQ